MKYNNSNNIREMQKVYLSLGGNLGNVYDCLLLALSLLRSHPNIFHLQASHFYLTSPVDMDTPHPFINTVCGFETNLPLDQLWLLTQSIEQKLGKTKKPTLSDRLIDIDILFYGNEKHQSKEITIPHPRWGERLFVLVPLQELTKNISLLDSETIVLKDLIDSLKRQSVQSISLLEKNPHIQ